MTEMMPIESPELKDVVHISILGATGTVGINTLKVIDQHQDRYSVIALTTNNQIDLLYQQCLKYRPKLAVVADEKLSDRFISKFQSDEYEPELLVGSRGLEVAASLTETNCVMAANVGAAG